MIKKEKQTEKDKMLIISDLNQCCAEISDRCGASILEDYKEFHQYHSIRELLKNTSKTISLVADFQHSSYIDK